jgi:hypothetical protein
MVFGKVFNELVRYILCLIAQNVAERFSSNSVVSHLYAAHCINDVSRGSILGLKIV